MTSMRVLQLCPNDHPPFLELCRNHAMAMARAGFVVDTVFFAKPTSEGWAGATYLGIESGTRRMINALREHCAAHPYRLVIAHRYRAYQAATRALRATAATTVITVAHEFGMLARRRRRWRHRLIAPRARFAGVSRAVADELLRDHPSLVSTLVLPNLADVERLDGERLSRDVARRRLEIGESDHVVGVIGRLNAKKRPLLALEGFAAATGLPANARLAFIGDGELRGRLETLATARNIRARVHLTGHLPDAAQYLLGFDVLLFATSAAEAFGMVLLEGMLAGVPIVCADVPGPRSVLGPDGLYFHGDDAAALAVALNRCASMSIPERARFCGALRSRAVREFSLAALAQVYRDVLNTDAARLRVES